MAPGTEARFALEPSAFGAAAPQALERLNPSSRGCDVVALALDLNPADPAAATALLRPFAGPRYRIHFWSGAFVVQEVAPQDGRARLCAGARRALSCGDTCARIGSRPMPPKKNPLNLNPLQLKTLTLLQALARLPGGHPPDESGAILVEDLPQPHGDHFHVGEAVAFTKDASGLGNVAVWVALERKGLIKSMFTLAALVTAEGLAYDTGMADQILHGAHHH